MVFISYSHRDKHWLDRLLIHLRPLEREGSVAADVWADTRIASGDRWRDDIRDAIEAADIAVLLVSADFLASDFIAGEELPPLLEAAEGRGVTILPIIVSPCRYEQTLTLSRYQSVNDPRKPLVKITEAEQEEVFVRLSDEISRALLKPIALLQQELHEKFRQSDAKRHPELEQIAKDPTLSEQDRLIYGLAIRISSNSEKALIVAKKLSTVDPADSLSGRKQKFLEEELEKLTRIIRELSSQQKAVSP